MDRAPQQAGPVVLGTRMDAVSLEDCVEHMIEWARRGESRCVCACNVHAIVSARLNPDFASVIASADLCVPDGAPVAWRMRRLGFPRQARVSGPEVMWRCCERAAESGLPVFLYGSTDATLGRLAANLQRQFPALRIAGCVAPPFRALTAGEDACVTRMIAESGARLVFVALGCPKQEAWMLSHRNSIRAVMLGAGAAFDFIAGTKRRAPRWMRTAGLEWLHRLCCEPRRLWWRYLTTNTLFLAWSLGELLGARAPRGEP